MGRRENKMEYLPGYVQAQIESARNYVLGNYYYRSTHPAEEEEEEEATEGMEVETPPQRLSPPPHRYTGTELRERRVFFIGRESAEERKKRFTQLFEPGEGARVRIRSPVKGDEDSLLQSPYNPKSWLDAKALGELSHRAGYVDTIRNAFHLRYRNMLERANPRPGRTAGILYTLHTQKAELFKDVLYNRNDLVLKLTPLFTLSSPLGPFHYLEDWDMQEIYNEIRIGFFLNELIYGYEHVLSIHFLTILDWFYTPRSPLLMHQLEAHLAPANEMLYQATVSEKLDESVEAFLTTNRTMATLRAVLFQVFDALEVAWHTNEFMHYDLYTENVMIRRYDTVPDSPFLGKNLLYKRPGDDHYWYVLSPLALGGAIIKLIDFGRSRMRVPKTPLSDASPLEHHHERLIDTVEGQEYIGVSPLMEPNRKHDVRLFLIHLFLMKSAYYWDAVKDSASPTEWREFTRFFDAALGLDELTAILSQRTVFTALGSEYARVVAPHGGFTFELLFHCPEAVAFMMEGVNFVRSREQHGQNVSEALDSPFFDALRVLPDLIPSPEKSTHHLVVSLPLHLEQIVQFNAGIGNNGVASSSSPCVVCHKPGAFHTKQSKSEYFCGEVCHEFKYIYKKTVYRD